MYLVRSIQYLIISQYLYLLAFCHNPEPNGRRSLILTERNGEFELTRPSSFDFKTATTHFLTPPKERTYSFCPYTSFDAYYLISIKQMERDKDITDRDVLCPDFVNVNLVKVQNPAKFKKISWNRREMELYHAGFLLYSGFVKKVVSKLNFIKTKPDYGQSISEHQFLTQIEFYYNIRTNRTVAARYKLIAVNFRYIRNMTFHKFADQLFNSHLTPTPPIFAFVDSSRYLEQFEGKISSKWMRVWSGQSDKNPLSLLEFASCEHFAIPLWAVSCRFNLNYILLWKIPKLMWLRVEIFARSVAQYLGDLHVTAGYTGIMTLSNKHVIDIHGYRMPKYFWKIFEYVKDKRVYGIIVVLNCNPFEETEQIVCEVDISCKENGWMIGNDDYATGEIYCCEMTTENLAKLDANYLSLKNREVFNLLQWKPESTNIQDTYNFIISRNEYKVNLD